MNLSIEVNIDEATAYGIAESLGMSMEVVEDPTKPSRKPTLEEVDHYLEGRMRQTIIDQYKPIIQSLYMTKINDLKSKMELTVSEGLEKAVKVGPIGD